MDLNAIKQKLDSLNKQSNYKKGSGKNLFWKPSVGKQVVRVVPNKYNKDFPFTEMMFYYGIGPRVMASPQNWNEKDPIQEFTKQLRTSNDKENWRLAKKLDAQIITITGDANKKWTFNSWDKFYLPKPFSKIIIHIAPVYEHNGTKPLHEGVSDYMVKHEKIASHKI